MEEFITKYKDLIAIFLIIIWMATILFCETKKQEENRLKKQKTMSKYKFGDIVPKELLTDVQGMGNDPRPWAKTGMTYVYLGTDDEFKYGEIIKLVEDQDTDMPWMESKETGKAYACWNELAQKSSIPTETPKKSTHDNENPLGFWRWSHIKVGDTVKIHEWIHKDGRTRTPSHLGEIGKIVLIDNRNCVIKFKDGKKGWYGTKLDEDCGDGLLDMIQHANAETVEPKKNTIAQKARKLIGTEPDEIHVDISIWKEEVMQIDLTK